MPARPRKSAYEVPQTLPRRLDISIQLHGSTCPRCSIFGLASASIPSVPAVQPFASFCRTEVGHPQRPWDAPMRRHRGQSCEGSYHGRSCRISGRGRENGRDLAKQWWVTCSLKTWSQISRWPYLLGWDCNGSSCADRRGTLLFRNDNVSLYSLCLEQMCIVKYTIWNKAAGTLTGVVLRFARKNSPDMFRASQRTTTIFCPLSNCLATVLARRPSRCPLPSMITCSRRRLN